MFDKQKYRLDQKIVGAIVRDIFSRIYLDNVFSQIPYDVQLSIYERWTELVSEELIKSGVLSYEEKYVKVSKKEDSLYVACGLVTDLYYISKEQREEKETFNTEMEEEPRKKQEEDS